MDWDDWSTMQESRFYYFFVKNLRSIKITQEQSSSSEDKTVPISSLSLYILFVKLVDERLNLLFGITEANSFVIH